MPFHVPRESKCLYDGLKIYSACRRPSHGTRRLSPHRPPERSLVLHPIEAALAYLTRLSGPLRLVTVNTITYLQLIIDGHQQERVFLYVVLPNLRYNSRKTLVARR